jgi:hypothetical protein
MGLEPAAIERIDLLSERHGHALWRVVTAARSYVLKWLPAAAAETEVRGYLLLRRIGVPTLPLYGYTAQALLMEDLTRSDRWRLAVAGDLSRPAVGRTVARWYRRFHEAGEALLSQGERPDFLTRETDVLNLESILATGRALDLAHLRVWDLAAGHIEALKAAVEALGVTLNYNDFYWTNLALSVVARSVVARSGSLSRAQRGNRPQRGGLTEPSLGRDHDESEAIIFDYHLLGVGMRYSDCRNVTHALSGDAARSFWEVYGAVDPVKPYSTPRSPPSTASTWRRACRDSPRGRRRV